MALIIVLIMPVTEQTHISYGFLKSLFLNDQGQKNGSSQGDDTKE